MIQSASERHGAGGEAEAGLVALLHEVEAYLPVMGSMVGTSSLMVNSKPLPRVPKPPGYGLT